MSKRRLAVLIAGLFAAPIGIAAVTGLTPEERLPPESVVQPQPAAPSATEQAPVEQAAPTEVQPTQEAGYVVPARPRTLADVAVPPLQSDVFPPSTDDKPLLPTLAAYLDRQAANTLLADAGAREPLFSESYDERVSPAVMAYFDRLEAERVAVAEARARHEQQMAAEARARQEQQAAAMSAPLAAAPDSSAQNEVNIDRMAENVRQ